MEKIILYSPVDGTIKPISELGDGVFSEGMLGEGFFIEPDSKEFFSPILKGEVAQVFDTKHAYFFKTEEGPVFLMHIGLDTVKLEGKPFDVHVKVGDKVDLKTKVVTVDYQMIEAEKLVKSTPIVLDTNEFSGWKFELYDLKGKVKHGTPIGEFIKQVEVKKENNENLTIEEEVNILLNTKGKYDLAAERIYKLVGTKSNYQKVFNCMTRLRFEIVDKDLVDESEIKKMNLVKGVIWSGNQCQIIIGGEVYKVREAVETYSNGLQSSSNFKKTIKPTFAKRILMAVSGIILPTLPVLMASGLLMGLKSVLVMSNAIVDMKIGSGSAINMNVDLFSLFINISAETGLKFLGVYIGYNTMKWLGGPAIMQILLSLAIAGATLGLGTLPDLTMFNINGFAIKAGIYTTSIIPHIASAFMLFYLDKWIKTWMPTSIDVLFRPLLSFIVAYSLIFFVFGPMLFLVEQGLAIVVNSIAKIPYGFGVMMFAIIWQPLVLTGMHVAVVMPVAVGIAKGDPTVLMTAVNIAVFAQLGAVVGVALKTKNAQLKSAAFASIPGAIVGVTEPVIYGINLPKWRPFLAGIITSGLLGLLSGLLAVESRVPGGLGIFGITATISDPVLNSTTDAGVLSAMNVFTGSPNSSFLNAALWTVVNIGAIPVAIAITYFIYQERPREDKAIIKVNNKLVKYYALALGIKQREAKQILADKLQKIEQLITKDDINKIKEIEKELIKVTSASTKLEKFISINEKAKEKIIKSIKKINEKPLEQNEDKVKGMLAKFNQLKDNEKISKLEAELEQLNFSNIENMKWLTAYQEDVLTKISEQILQISLDSKKGELAKVNDIYWNGIHSVDINYLINEAKTTKIDKKILK